MTVSELIEELKQYQGDLPIVTICFSSGTTTEIDGCRIYPDWHNLEYLIGNGLSAIVPRVELVLGDHFEGEQ